MIVVVNATPLIALSKVGKLTLLQDIFGTITIPQGVYTEVVIQGAGRSGAARVRAASWIETHEVSDRTVVDFLRSELDIGEAEVLALAREMNADVVIIDEEKARIAARLVGINQIGTLGVLIMAKRRELIQAVKPLLDELRQKKFWISDRVYNRILKESGETL